MKSHLSLSISPLFHTSPLYVAVASLSSANSSPPPHLHCHLPRHLRRQPCFSPLHRFCSFPLLRRPYQMVKASSSTSSVLGEPFVCCQYRNRSIETCANFNIYFKSIENFKRAAIEKE